MTYQKTYSNKFRVSMTIEPIVKPNNQENINYEPSNQYNGTWDKEYD